MRRLRVVGISLALATFVATTTYPGTADSPVTCYPIVVTSARHTDTTRAVSTPKHASTSRAVQQEEVELLARVVHAEARGESMEGKIAVAAVVLNRVRDPHFPSTVREVIQSPGQFAISEGTPSEDCYQAVYAALRDQDPSGGALYFYNPKTASCSWIRTRKTIVDIGSHRFAK